MMSSAKAGVEKTKTDSSRRRHHNDGREGGENCTPSAMTGGSTASAIHASVVGPPSARSR